MADYKSLDVMQGDEHVVGIARPIVQVFDMSENTTDDMIKFLSDMKISLSISRVAEALGNTSGMSENEERHKSLHEKIMNYRLTWEHRMDEGAVPLTALGLMEIFRCLSLNGCQENSELLPRVHSILLMPLSRLEEEFSRILIENKLPLKPEHLPFQSTNDDISCIDLIASVDNEPSEGNQVKPRRDNTRGLEEFIIDLVHPNVIPDLKCMAEVMLASGHDAECRQSYISIRKYALEECLLVLEVEKLSIKDVLQMDWSSLNSKIKKWVRAAKIAVCVYLSSEKSLANKVFGISGSVKKTCFVEASKSLILQLLSFGEVVAMRNYSPEKICSMLYMSDGLLNLLPDIDVFFSDEAGSCVITEAHEVLSGLGESVMRTLNLLEIAVKTNELSPPAAAGGVHQLTRYVMNYLKALTDYSDTLNFLLKVGGDDHSPSSSDVNTAIDNDGELNSSHSVSPMGHCLQSMLSILELNLKSKSQLYKNVSFQHFFLLNNISYVAQKVKDSELRHLLGEKWIRKHNEKCQQHAINYESASWSPVLSFLGDEHFLSGAILRERFHGFNLAFEEIYRTQTGWLIDNDQLREELRISISLKVLQAYRSFVNKYFDQLGSQRSFLGKYFNWLASQRSILGKYFDPMANQRHRNRYIKYSVADLGGFLFDLFEGQPRRLLHKSHRR